MSEITVKNEDVDLYSVPESKRSIVKQFRFPVSEPTGKRDIPQSELSVEEMVKRALDGAQGVERIWCSRRDTDNSFLASTGETVLPKNGVPRGQVWLFVGESHDVGSESQN